METSLIGMRLRDVVPSGKYHKAPDVVLRLLKRKCQENNESVDEYVPTMDISSEDHKRGSPVLHVDQDLVPMSSEQEIMETYVEDQFCQNIRKMVRTEPSRFFDQQELICRRSTIDGSTQVFVPLRYRWVVLYNSGYPWVAGHPGVRGMYD